MPISSEHVGRRYPPTPVHEVQAAEVAAFAQALGQQPGDEAPPTFAMVLAAPAWEQLFADPELGLALERTMHAEQGLELHRPIRVGDRLRAELEITKVRARGASAFVTIRVDVSTVDGDVVVSAPSTFVCTVEEAA